MRPALLQFARFLVAGAVNTVASYAIFLVLLQFMPYLAAYTIAYVIGVGISYVLLTSFVFRTPRRVATALRFPLVYVAQYLTGSVVIVLLVDVVAGLHVGCVERRAALLNDHETNGRRASGTTASTTS